MRLFILGLLLGLLLAFPTGLVTGHLARWVYDVSQPTPQVVQATIATPTPRQDPKTAYYIGVYDTCMNYNMLELKLAQDESMWLCLIKVQEMNAAGWYEASGDK